MNENILSGQTLLVIDDAEMNRRIISEVFGDKYQVLTAENGEIGMEILHHREIDIVLLDIVMPVMGGFEVLKIMKADPYLKDIPVVVITGEMGKAEKKALELGADDFMEQPYDSFIMKKRVENLINRYEMRKLRDQLFDTLSNAAENVYIFENDMEINYSKWSDNAVEYFDLPEDYHTNILEEWVERIHADDRQIYLKEIDAVFSGEKEKHCSQYRVKNRYGDYVWVECNGNVAKDKEGKMKIFAGTITRLDNQSKYDPLTKKLAIHQFYLNNETEESFIALLLGMDGFRRVIHSYGYEAGNELLTALAEELDRPALKQRVYRMNGDGFLVIIPEISIRQVKEYFFHVKKSFKDRCVSLNYSKNVTFSCACDIYRPEEVSKDTMIQRLEHTMEQAKSLGGGRIMLYSKEIEDNHRRTYEIGKELETAIANNYEGFELYYQPVMTIAEKKIRSVEALLRFHSEKMGWVSPIEFIPILESTRAIRSVGLWVMEQVIKQNKIWNEKYCNIKTAFNASYLQLYNDTFLHKLIHMVEQYEVDPNLIVVELTESCKVLHPESLSMMFEKLIKYGFMIALDDFGMENSTLTILRDIPVTTVKIDHSFVRTITGDASRLDQTNLAIVQGIITMCKKLSYNVVVEGIENKAVAEMMKELGAEYLQGYYFSQPIPAAEVEKFFN